jgi:uncharacterized lipoprotein YddW (UPF0748 family)
VRSSAAALLLAASAAFALPEEVHGVWSGWGMYAGQWEETVSALGQSPVNLLMPDLIYGCAAAFDTDLLPSSRTPLQGGDYVRECIDACHSRGIEVHAWVILWKTNLNDSCFVDSMRRGGRTQVSSEGGESSWLCPTDPDNRELMLSLIGELVRGYDLDGIQLDYIRFPDRSHCYCQGCRDRFEEVTGICVRRWPDQVLEGGRYREEFLEWRTGTITDFVRDVRDLVRTESPGTLLSAAVLPDREDALGNGQDWAAWAEEGVVDFIVPMDYTDSLELFSQLLDAQLVLAGDVPVVPGIGSNAGGLDLSPDEISCQMAVAIRAGAAGWALFHLNSALLQAKLPAVDYP